MNRIERITKMEECLEVSAEAVKKLSEALEAYETALREKNRLFDYYGSVQWMRDYEADEAGKLPKDLKRGVLSEDTVYDLILEDRDLAVRMAKLVTEHIEHNAY